MKVDKHISELLFEHDCVIVPDFGGFVANHAPAKIHPVKHTFTPPSKNISFNKNLKSNDGLLANHISTTEKTTYPEALKYISHFTSDTQSRLRKGEKVTVDEIGSLYLDSERNIQFEPGTTNYLLDAFGLPQFQSPAIKRDTITKRIEKEFIDRGPVTAEKKKINVKRYVALAIAAPVVILGAVWLSLNINTIKNINYSSLNPFAVSEVVKSAEKAAAETKEAVKQPVETIAIAKDSAKPVLSTSQPVTASLVESKAVGLVKADSTKVSVTNLAVNKELKFHLITGCFQVPENADRFVGILQSQNLTASIIGKRNGLLVVSSGDFANREEALAQLVQLKKSQPEAWLLVK